MATKSIIKNVDIKTPKLRKNFVEALENAENKKSKQVIISRTISTVTGDKIKELFGDKE